MKLLVTGANGFIGSALCQAGRSRGISILGAIRSINQVNDLPFHVEPLVVDTLVNLAQHQAILSQVDCIVHLAARAHMMRDSVDDPLAAFRAVNTNATCDLARAASERGVRRFIYISSIKVNGEGQPDCPAQGAKTYTELSKPDPKDPYGVSKWEAEQLLAQIAMETGLEIVVLRPPLVYGPQVKANFLQLMRLVKLGIPLPFGQVNNLRSMIFVDNLVNAIFTCVFHPAAVGQTFLVSDGVEISTPALIRHLAAALDRPTCLLPLSTRWLRLIGQMTGKSTAIDRLLGSLTIDISHIHRVLNWHPPFSLEQGLEETAEWYLKSQI
jgi:UDP-4-keto-D-QuiNAc 4-reductase